MAVWFALSFFVYIFTPMKLVQGDIAVVTEVDPSNMLVRVNWPAAEVSSPWLMYIVPLGYHMPEINEQVVCFYDEFRRSGVAFGNARKEGDAPFDDKDIVGIDLGSAVLTIKRSSGEIKIQTDGKISVKASEVSIDAPELKVSQKMTVGGALSVTGVIESSMDVKAPGVSLLTHTHVSAAPGSPTTPPTPAA